MQLIKMQSAGNDYIYTFTPFPEKRIARLCDRNKGVGGDGVVYIYKTESGYGYRMFNKDGSEGAFCGNATFCVTKILKDKGLISGDNAVITTRSGDKEVAIKNYNKSAYVFVNVGKPKFYSYKKGVETGKTESENFVLRAGGKEYIFKGACISVGNPHAVIFTQIKDKSILITFAKQVNSFTKNIFPDGVNVQFVDYKNSVAYTTVYERGSGFTASCASGAAAVFSAIKALKEGVKELAIRFPKGTIYAAESGDNVTIGGFPEYCFTINYELKKTKIKKSVTEYKGDYVFTKVRQQTAAFKQEHPEVKIIDLGVGDVKFPPPKAVSRAMRKAVKDLSRKKTFVGYPPEGGFDFLKRQIVRDYAKSGITLHLDEIFITDGIKGAISGLFSLINAKTALIFPPTYPLYKTACAINGVRLREIKSSDERVVFPPLQESENCDIIFVCSPSNPTGAVIDKQTLSDYIKYAKAVGALIVFDGAYADFCTCGVKSVFEADGADEVAIELKSYSKSISFTGVRCGYTIIKRENPLNEGMKKLEGVRSNGVNYIAQRGAAASYGAVAQKQLKRRIAYYRKNGEIIACALKEKGFSVTGGQNAPYVFCKVDVRAVEFCRLLLDRIGIVATPCDGFGCENHVRFSCFCTRAEALAFSRRIKEFDGKE